jgi:hypothetical protein
MKGQFRDQFIGLDLHGKEGLLLAPVNDNWRTRKQPSMTPL